MEQRVFRLVLVIFISLRLSYVVAINIHHNIRITSDGFDSPQCVDVNNTFAACKTLDYVLSHIESNASLENSTKIIIESGVYALNRSYSFENINNFQIIGVAGAQVSSSLKYIISGADVVIQCNMGAGLAFLRSENLTFSYLTFQNCGSWQNNTSINNPKFLAAIFIVYSKNLEVIGCRVSRSPGVGVNLYDVNGDILIENSTFAENYAFDSWNFTYRDGKVRAGGGLHIEFTYCGAVYPFECNDIETDKYNHGSRYTIRNCKFIDNTGTTGHVFKQTFNLNPCEKDFNSIGRGGGISYIIKGNATGNQFLVDNCTFLRNTADWGGGYAVYFQDNATNNSLRVINSRFLQNLARYGGGAVKCATTIYGTFRSLTAREPNYYLHENCIFERNLATEGWGGAFSVFGSTSYLGTQGWQANKTPAFVNCHWRENSATAGAAIGALTKLPELWRRQSVGLEERGFGFALKLVNNTFTKNVIIPTIHNVTVFGMGTIYTVFVPIIMTGDVKFIGNSNTALLLDSACAEIDGNVLFHKNNGVYGGAVGMYGSSAFVFKPGSKLMFKENSASGIAGAIYVKTAGPNIAAFYQTIFQRHRCFFRYIDSSVGPNDWNVSVVFQGNNASLHIGRTLFANTLQFCRFGRSGLINDAIKSWKSFKFENHDGLPSNDDLEVATEPVQILINPNEWNNISPNEQFSPSIQLLDERNHSVYGLIKVSIKEQSSSKSVNIEDGVSPYFYVKDQINSLWLSGKPSSHFNASITSLHSQSMKMTLPDLTVKECPPGYIHRDNTCVCLIVQDRIIGISRCGDDGKSLYLRKGYWGGPRHSNAIKGKSCLFSVVECPYGYCQCGSNSMNGLTNQCECYFNATVNQCVEGREGILCGECKDGLSVVIGSFKCLRCQKNDTLMLIPFFVILTFLVFLFLYFKLDFFSGYLNCWLYTYQIIFLLLPDHLLAGDPFMNFIVKLANMKFVFGSWCLWDGMDDLQKTSFGYVAPVYQIFVLFVFIKLSSKFSILQGNFFRPFCTILVLSYSAIVNVTFKQLQPVHICSEWRVYMSARLKFFRDEHIIYASLAIVVLLFVILPFPVMLAYSSLFTGRSRRLSQISMPLLDVLKSCYRSKRRWFAAYYIVCRLIAVLLHTYILDINARHKVLQIFCVVVLLLFLYLKPYQNDILTKIDTFFLSFLVLMSLLAEVVITCSFFVSQFFDVCFYCIHILLYVPFLYSLIMLYYHGRHLVRQRKQKRGNDTVNCQPVVEESTVAERTRYEPL
ncbi:Hypothetical predicted protein [Paramuricea clavata]|uniref:Uncharacterized protein n=1 Tax=Paramuricea clavata TaxID=317549 RepID=A0A7D9IRC3_PARCT|nr:Hypothetical predicted protein [Paramuricea clavata]